MKIENKRKKTKTTLFTPVGYRTGRNLGSVARQNAIIFAVYPSVRAGMSPFECSLRPTRADGSILLTLGAAWFGNVVDCGGVHNIWQCSLLLALVGVVDDDIEK